MSARMKGTMRDDGRPASVPRRRFLGYGGAGMLAAALGGCGDGLSASPYSRTIALGSQLIQAQLDGNAAVASLSVALLQGDRIVWQQAFGHAAMSPPVDATGQTRYNIGSCSKVVAALAALILQDRGQINLDTAIVRYLPTFTMLSPGYVDITTRHLLSHASGFPGTNGRNAFMLGAPATGYAADTEAALANQHLKHRPGELAVYCNDGFTMIEQIVAAVTGMRYADFVQQTILAPLGMTDSGFLTSVPTAGAFALPYRDGKPCPQEFVSPLASGGLSTTPADMMKLAQLFVAGGTYRGQRIVSAAGIADMGSNQTSTLQINPSPEWQWGLGWDNVRAPNFDAAGVTAWSKGGDTDFFHSEFIVLPAAQLALMISGHQGYEAAPLVEGILFQALQEAGTLGAARPAQVGVAVPATTAAPDVSAAAGIYANLGKPLQVQVAADGLMINAWTGTAWSPLTATPCRYRSDGWWWSDGSATSYRLTVVADPDDPGVQYRYLMSRSAPGLGYAYVTTPIGQQLSTNAPPLSAAWQARMNTTWRPTNESASSAPAIFSSPLRTTLSAPDWAPGYILVCFNDYDIGTLQYQLLTPLADDRGGMSVKIPVLWGRDLLEVSFASNGAAEQMTAGSLIYRNGAST